MVFNPNEPQNGEVVDAIINVGEKILPIDSKFSMENFRLYKEAKTDEIPFPLECKRTDTSLVQ